MISFVNKGPLYPKFQELLSKMDLDDWIGPSSIERYKLEANLIDAVHLNASLQQITKLALQLIRLVSPRSSIVIFMIFHDTMRFALLRQSLVCNTDPLGPLSICPSK